MDSNEQDKTDYIARIKKLEAENKRLLEVISALERRIKEISDWSYG